MTKEELMSNPGIKAIIDAVAKAFDSGGNAEASAALMTFKESDPEAYLIYLENYIQFLEEELFRAHEAKSADSLIALILARRGH